MQRWTQRISRAFLVLCILALVAFIVGLVLLGSAWKAPRGCEECDPYFGRMMLVYGLFALSVLFAIIGLVFRTASSRIVKSHVTRGPNMGGP
jgi:uncharacterized BrkB/YihY/UPF0761 family membrane protein